MNLSKSTQSDEDEMIMKTRSFRAIGGFGDGTERIEIDDDGSWLVFKRGTRKKTRHYKLKTCLEFVKEKVWEEITP